MLFMQLNIGKLIIQFKIYFSLYLDTDNEKIMLPALRRFARSNTEVHIIYAGQYNLDWIHWDLDVLQRIVDTGLKPPAMTFIYMYRAGL